MMNRVGYSVAKGLGMIKWSRMSDDKEKPVAVGRKVCVIKTAIDVSEHALECRMRHTGLQVQGSRCSSIQNKHVCFQHLQTPIGYLP